MKGKLVALRLALTILVLLAGLGTIGRAQEPAEAGYWDRTPLPLTGLATFYAEGLMDYVRGYRLGAGQVGDCPECVGAVALLRAGDVGRKVWLQPPGGERVGPFLVVDCARREDYPRLLARGWAVDVSYELGQLWGMTAPLGGVTVLEDPADVIAGPPRRFSPYAAVTPFVVPPGQVVISAPTATATAQPPSEIAALPTPWPTRLPVALAHSGVSARPTAIQPLPTPLWPPPLTPIVTTPTPVVTPGSMPEAPPVESTVQPTSTPPVEVAVGRAGAGLLGEPTAAVPTLVVKPTITATPTRTPRPDLTPILPDVPTPTLTPTPVPSSLLEQIWQALLEWVRP